MIISINAIQNYLIEFLNKFASDLRESQERAIELEVINTYNHPYLASYNPRAGNILVVKFDTIDNLFENATRAGKFYTNINEFTLNFALFFISFIVEADLLENTDAYNNMLAIYELFSEFLYNNNYRLKLESINNTAEHSYTTNITYYIYPTSGMQNNGLLTLDSRNSNSAYCANNAFKASVRVEEILEKTKEPELATRYN
ncbi:hypothetical protein DB313_06250 (plasmid) [Borrelia turcica IST7]|uniref:Uncharacterized protein n=1 Tax=Borrelia turcica IST7 TaxID=1104446 RepID=A0A386PNQ7_9SPIR|nr:DUF764 family protein [Borrelia turcica]AYE37101.1 hypothetical protein DB313_06250 [Borrelia turcica IST7]